MEKKKRHHSLADDTGDESAARAKSELVDALNTARAKNIALRAELEALKEKRARDVLAVMQQRDEVACS